MPAHALVRRSPPAGSPVRVASLLRLLREPDPAGALEAGLGTLLGPGRLCFYASGREALRAALTELAREGGRSEVVVPAYTCYSVAASVVAAGLRVRLVDVDAGGRIEPAALAALPLERALALVVCNLFGHAEPIGAVLDAATPLGVAVVDDAAQALGARGPEGAVGARGTLGLLSFARGKPLSALGGGALLRHDDPPDGAPAPPAPRRLGALLRACAYDVALSPFVFGWLAAIPALHIGETRFDPVFPGGPIDGPSLALASALVGEVERAGARRERAVAGLADRIEAVSGFVALRADPGTRGVAPRLALRAPSAQARDEALRRLAAFGATGLYPESLDALEALAPHREEGPACPGARELAARLLTLPAREPTPIRLEKMLEVLASIPA